MKTVKIGIASLEDMRQRTLDIVEGKVNPKPDDPKIWFTSIDALYRRLGIKK